MPEVLSLIEKLSDGNASVRNGAAADLGKMGDTRAVEPLIKALGDRQEWSVRCSAAEALGELGDTRAIESLISALEDPEKYVRAFATKALGELGDPRAVDPLIDMLEDPYAADWAAESLGKLGDVRAIEPLIAALSYPDSEVSLKAVTALAHLGCQSAVTPLIKMLRLRRGYQDRVFQATASALGTLGDARAVEPLLMAALGDGHDAVRSSSAASLAQLRALPWSTLVRGDDEDFARLGRSGDIRAIKPLIRSLPRNWYRGDDPYSERVRAALAELRAVEPVIAILRQETESEWRIDAAYALGALNDIRAIEPLVAALGDPEAKVRSAAATALGQLGQKQSLDPLMGLLTDQDENVRQGAITALGRLGDSRAVEPLIAILINPKQKLSGYAATALGKLGDARAIEPLRKILFMEYDRHAATHLDNLDDGWRCDDAAAALGRLDAIEPLLVALEDPRNPVRIAAAKAFAFDTTPDPRAVAPLIARLPDRDAGEYAAKALGKLGDPRAVEPLIARLGVLFRDPRAAISALAKLGDARAIEPLTKMLWDEAGAGYFSAARIEAAYALVKLRAIEPLAVALGKGSCRDLHVDIALALCKTDDLRAMEPLVRFLNNTSDADARRLPTVVNALRQFGDHQAVGPLVSRVKAMTSGGGFNWELVFLLRKIVTVQPRLLHRSQWQEITAHVRDPYIGLDFPDPPADLDT
jgi:HEAT repeat protein